MLGATSARALVLETCTEAFRIAGRARQQGHDVRVVAATLVRSLGVGQRGLKNDRRDVRALSAASCRIELPSVPHSFNRQPRGQGHLCVTGSLDQDPHAAGEPRA